MALSALACRVLGWRPVAGQVMPLAEWASSFLPEAALEYLDFYPEPVVESEGESVSAEA